MRTLTEPELARAGRALRHVGARPADLQGGARAPNLINSANQVAGMLPF